MRACRSSRATTALVPARPRVIGGDDRHRGVIAVPVHLPDAEVGRTHLRDVAGSEVDQEQSAPRITRPPNDRIGLGLGATDRTRSPVQPVGTGIGGEHQEAVAVSGPRDALGRTGQRGRQRRFATGGRHRVRQLMPGRDAIGQERQPGTVGRPGRQHVGERPIGEPHRVGDGSRIHHVEIARHIGPDVGHGRVQGEHQPRSVGRERQLRRCLRVQQQLGRGCFERGLHGRVSSHSPAPARVARRRKATDGCSGSGGKDCRGRRCASPRRDDRSSVRSSP